jgi:hypothetical protein
VIAWRFTDAGGMANAVWLALGVAATLNFLLANANPLAQLEGSLILMNWLEIPRLRERANAIFGAWLYRRPDPEPLLARDRRRFILYGAASFVFVVLMMYAYFAWTWLTRAADVALLPPSVCTCSETRVRVIPRPARVVGSWRPRPRGAGGRPSARALPAAPSRSRCRIPSTAAARSSWCRGRGWRCDRSWRGWWRR